MALPFRDLVDIRLYAALDEGGSVGRAARMSAMSQPAASRRLHDMQRRSGGVLYVLGPRGTVLTAAGRFWATEAQAVLSMLTDASDRFAGGQWAVESLNFYVSHVIADYLLPTWLDSWSDSESQPCHVEVGNSEVVQRSVTSGHVEFGLLQTSGHDIIGLKSLPLMSDRLITIVANDHPWARREQPLSVEEFAQTPLVCREASSGTQQMLTVELHNRGLQMATPAVQVQSTLAVRSAVARGIAPGILPGIAIREDLIGNAVSAVEVVGLEIEVWVSAVFRDGATLSAAARSFLGHVRNITRGPGAGYEQLRHPKEVHNN